jgi:hypothetical protein
MAHVSRGFRRITGLVPRLRRSDDLWIDVPALPDWADVWQSALRAGRSDRDILPCPSRDLWITSSHTDSGVLGYFHTVPPGRRGNSKSIFPSGAGTRPR